MPRESFSRPEALKRSVGNVVRELGAIVSGKQVLVSVPRHTYGERVEHFMQTGDPDYISAAAIVNKALRRAPISIGDNVEFADHFGLEEGDVLFHPWDAMQAPDPKVVES